MNIIDTKAAIKRGSRGALYEYIQYMHSESLSRLKTEREDVRYYQSRVVLLEDLLELLKEASK